MHFIVVEQMLLCNRKTSFEFINYANQIERVVVKTWFSFINLLSNSHFHPLLDWYGKHFKQGCVCYSVLHFCWVDKFFFHVLGPNSHIIWMNLGPTRAWFYTESRAQV